VALQSTVLFGRYAAVQQGQCQGGWRRCQSYVAN